MVSVLRGGALALLAFIATAPRASAQTLSAAVSGDAIRVHASGWSFLTGEPLSMAKEGRTVRIELGLLVLASPGRAPAAAARQVFSVSYDLWEERFAVSAAGPHPAVVSHLTAAAAESWCVEQLAVPTAAVGGLDDRRFWVRLEARMLDGGTAADPDESAGLTLQRLIDVLSRRRKTESPAGGLEGGPFRLPR